jgi:hypothetical protein
MLPGIADEQYAVLGTDLLEEVAHLFGAGKARLIEHVQVTAAVRLDGSGKEALQGIGTDTGVAELVRGARGWGETFHYIAALLCAFADAAEYGRFA